LFQIGSYKDFYKFRENNILTGISKIEVKKVKAQTIRIIGNYPNDSIEISDTNINRFYAKNRNLHILNFKSLWKCKTET